MRMTSSLVDGCWYLFIRSIYLYQDPIGALQNGEAALDSVNFRVRVVELFSILLFGFVKPTAELCR